MALPLRRHLRSLGRGLLPLAVAGCGGGGSARPASGGPIRDGGVALMYSFRGDGAACTPESPLTVAAKLTLEATWPAAIAVVKGMGPVNIWLLSTYDVDSNNGITGSTRMCGHQTPPIPLNVGGGPAVGSLPAPQIETVIPLSTWDAKDMSITPVTGIMGGWNINSSIDVGPWTTIEGLTAQSPYADPDMPWPDQGAQIDPTDIMDSDDDGHPGITGLPLADGGFTLPRVDVASDAVQADQLYLVLRTGVSLSGTLTSCSEQTGIATVALLDSHVIGCRRVDTMMDCMPADWRFVDLNTPILRVMSGTFDAKVLSTSGGPATCDDVLAQTYAN